MRIKIRLILVYQLETCLLPEGLRNLIKTEQLESNSPTESCKSISSKKTAYPGILGAF